MHEELNHQSSPSATNGSSNAIIAGAALLGGAALLAGTKTAHAVTPALKFSDIPGSGDIKVLNYALALEALEADLYRQALARLQALGLSDSRASVKYIEEFGVVENDHRDFLKSALGSQAITNTTLAGVTFNFGITSNTTEAQIVDLVLTAEALGVRAYLGAIPFFDTTKYLQVAAAIQGTEARHTAAITVVKNELFGGTASPAPLYTQNHGIDSPLLPDAVLQQVSPFIVLPANN